MEQQNKNINITYETLFDLLMRERNRDELQELPGTFFTDVVDYILEKRKILDDNQSQSELFSDVEREKTEKQLQNIKRILNELYDRREKKIIHLALNKSRTQSNIIDTSTLLKEEKELYDFLVYVLNKYRFSIVHNLVKGQLPSVKELKIEEKTGVTEKTEEVFKTASNLVVEKKEIKTIRFLYAVPQFVGKEMEPYGPFEEEDIANLPVEVSDILIRKGRAEEIQEQ